MRATKKGHYLSSSGAGLVQSQTRFPLQSSASISNINSHNLNMTKKFAAPIDSLDQIKSYAANKR